MAPDVRLKNWCGIGSFFAARVLKKPNLDGCGLVELASDVGLSYEDPKGGTFLDWPGWVFLT